MRELRIRAGMTQAELAQAAGVSTPSVYRIEQGHVAMRRLVVSRILHALSQKLQLAQPLTFDDVDGLRLVD